MRTRCDEAQTQLADTNESCKSLLDRAGSLREQRYSHSCYSVRPRIDVVLVGKK